MTTDSKIEMAQRVSPVKPLFGAWVATADNPHKGEIKICAWNCEHGVWDDADGDDFCYTTAQVSHWMPLPSLPLPNAEGETRRPSAPHSH